MKIAQTVFVGLSGGVDSSVAAYLLQKQGYQLVGVYMKNWTQDIGDYSCPWRKDYLDAKRLAAFLRIPFLVFDFQKQYKQLVVDYMLAEYQKGNTPNPDIQCNQMIKFDLFLKSCLKEGADFIATGHYAQVKAAKLYQATDSSKDQTYFLYRLPQFALSRVLFPIGGLTKKRVRQIAQVAGLPNAQRPESMGICFVGEVGLVDFLKNYLKSQLGDIIDDRGQIVGQHQGAIFYTIGQRRGLKIGGGLPYYVVGKNIDKNEVYVSRNLNHHNLWQAKLNLQASHWLDQPNLKQVYQLRSRHGGQLIEARITRQSTQLKQTVVKLQEPTKAAASGQSAVLYHQKQVIGGGIINFIPTKI